MPSKLPSASIRYFRARLGVLQRPSVCGAAALLFAGLFILAEYWSQPDRLLREMLSDSSSREELDRDAIPLSPLDPFSRVADSVVDLENGSENQFGTATSTSLQLEPDSLEPDSHRNDFQGIDSVAQVELETLSQLLAEPLTFSLPPIPTNLVSLSANAPVSSPSSGSVNQPEPDIRNRDPLFSSLATVNNSDFRIDSNPLQAALDRHVSLWNPPETSGISGTSTNILTNTPVNQPLAAPVLQPEPEPSSLAAPLNLARPYLPQPLPGQPSRNQTFPQPIYIPQTSPAPGSTGYTLPQSLRVPAFTTIDSSDTNLNLTWSQSLPGQLPQSVMLPTTVQSETFTVQPQLTQPEPVPFSIPRSAPGRAISGGQINTFSNP